MPGESYSEVLPKLLQKTFKALLLFTALSLFSTTVSTTFKHSWFFTRAKFSDTSFHFFRLLWHLFMGVKYSTVTKLILTASSCSLTLELKETNKIDRHSSYKVNLTPVPWLGIMRLSMTLKSSY